MLQKTWRATTSTLSTPSAPQMAIVTLHRLECAPARPGDLLDALTEVIRAAQERLGVQAFVAHASAHLVDCSRDTAEQLCRELGL